MLDHLANLMSIKQIGFLDSLVDLRITKFYSLYYLFLDTSSIEVAAELEMEFGIEEYCKYIYFYFSGSISFLLFWILI